MKMLEIVPSIARATIQTTLAPRRPSKNRPLSMPLEALDPLIAAAIAKTYHKDPDATIWSGPLLQHKEPKTLSKMGKIAYTPDNSTTKHGPTTKPIASSMAPRTKNASSSTHVPLLGQIPEEILIRIRYRSDIPIFPNTRKDEIS